MIRLFRYIKLSEADAAVRAGYLPSSDLVGVHHGEYAVLMEWLCQCPEPLSKRPKHEQAQKTADHVADDRL